MEKIVLCVLFLALAISLWLLYDYSVKITKQCKANDSDEAEDGNESELPPDGQYSESLADSCVTDDYRHAYRRSAVVEALANSEPLRSLWSRLEHLSQSSKQNGRPDNDLDKWFAENIEEFVKYGETLAFIEYRMPLVNMFFDNLYAPWKNADLQKMLISVCKGGYKVNYVNLLCRYLCQWDLQSDIKAVVFYDERFERVKRIYNTYRPSSYT